MASAGNIIQPCLSGSCAGQGSRYTNCNFVSYLGYHLAGIVEGYLTRNTISEYYKEFFANGVCLENPDFCAYMRKQIDVNERWTGEMVEEKEEEDPYWHMVNLFYSQVRNQKLADQIPPNY